MVNQLTKCPSCRAIASLRKIFNKPHFVAWKCTVCGEAFTEALLDDCAIAMGRHPLGNQATS